MKKFAIAATVVFGISGIPPVTTAVLAASVPLSQLNMDAVPNISPEGVRRVQSLLKDKSFDPGPIDGVDGVRTVAATRAFQEMFGIKSSGAMDNQTLFALGAIDLAGPGG